STRPRRLKFHYPSFARRTVAAIANCKVKAVVRALLSSRKRLVSRRLRVEKNASDYSLAFEDHIIVLATDAHISLSSREAKFSHVEQIRN
ncbi:MAG: hypothetical protein WB496_12410, partial [Pseudolabrys sp.]